MQYVIAVVVVDHVFLSQAAVASRPPPPTAKQVESRASDGRRRIAPQFLGGYFNFT